MSSKVICFVVLLVCAGVLATEAEFVVPSALDNGSPYDALWICTIFGSGTPKVECGSAKPQFANLAKSIVPSSALSLQSAQMVSVPAGCCFQMDIQGTNANSTASDKVFAFMSNGNKGLSQAATQAKIANWAKHNGHCGPNAAISFIVGWDVYIPLKVKYFGCNIGTLGTKMASMCKC